MEKLTESEAKYYLESLRKLADSKNTEKAHYDADTILAEILDKLGYQEITDAYWDIEKWYS